MTSHVFQERFVLLLRSAYDNGCHGLVKRRPTVVPGASSSLGSKLPGARGIRPVSFLGLASTSRPGRPLGRRVGPVRDGPLGASETHLRTYATSTGPPPPRRIAILGGGITGLTAAHYLARHAQNAHIVLYESGDRLGGWINGQAVKVDPSTGQDVLLQRGPRMLRSGAGTAKYDDLVLYDVLANLDIADKVVYPQGAANSRYLYYPDHLVKLPSENLSLPNVVQSLFSYFTEPLWNGSLTGILSYAQRMQNAKNRRDAHVMETRMEALRNGKPWQMPQFDSSRFDEDESVASFLKDLLLAEEPVRNIVSGMLHGIYGGDVNQLSAKHTIFQNLWLKSRSWPGDEMAWIAKKEVNLCFDMMSSPNREKITQLAETAVQNKLIAFDDGLLTLVRTLEQDLQNRPNVEIRRNAPVASLSHEKEGVQVTSRRKTEQFDQVLSTIYSRQLAEIAKPADSLPSLAAIPSVTIMVVNMWFPDPHLLDDNPGFGYLVPQGTPVEENPERVLGVLFDSDIQTRSEVPGTKLTVMLGGHHWNDWHFLPSEDTGIQMARSAIHRHLGIPLDAEGLVASARLCRDCLPQHTVGHRQRLSQAHHELEAAFHGKVMVAGPSYTTVGVIPAMRAGYDAGMRIATGHGQPFFKTKNVPVPGMDETFLSYMQKGFGEKDPVGLTGLQWATEPEAYDYTVVQKDTMVFKTGTKDTLRFGHPDSKKDVGDDE